MACAEYNTCGVFSSWRYDVQVLNWDGVFDTKFWKVSEIAMEVEIEEIYRGGSGVADKYPGRAKTEPVTFEKGATADASDIKWFEKVADFPNGKFGSSCGLGDYKHHIVVSHLGQNCAAEMKNILHWAWPHKISFGELDNEASEKVIRKMTIVFDWVETQVGADRIQFIG